MILIIILSQYLLAQDYSVSELADSALSLTKDKVIYDPSYFKIDYPKGDVPANKGVCTDVIIRAYRKLNIDLQRLVHEDMSKNFSKYPQSWGLKSTDKNIDHRRVPNLMKFFERSNASLKITDNSKDYKPGDIIAWKLPNGRFHIGILSNKKSADQKRYLIIHNIGAGQILEDCLFAWEIIGHYRWNGK